MAGYLFRDSNDRVCCVTDDVNRLCPRCRTRVPAARPAVVRPPTRTAVAVDDRIPCTERLTDRIRAAANRSTVSEYFHRQRRSIVESPSMVVATRQDGESIPPPARLTDLLRARFAQGGGR